MVGVGGVYTVSTLRRFNVHTMSFQCYGRCIDVETTLCVCVQRSLIYILKFVLHYVGLFVLNYFLRNFQLFIKMKHFEYGFAYYFRSCLYISRRCKPHQNHETEK